MTVLFPLTFASNVFVDPATMPGWLQAFVDVNPISHLVDRRARLMHGDVDAGDIGWVLLWCAGLLAVFAPLTMRRYNRSADRQQQRRGLGRHLELLVGRDHEHRDRGTVG